MYYDRKDEALRKLFGTMQKRESYRNRNSILKLGDVFRYLCALKLIFNWYESYEMNEKNTIKREKLGASLR